MNKLALLNSHYLQLCRRTGAALHAPTRGQVQFVLFAAGVLLLSAGYLEAASASGGGHHIQYNDVRLALPRAITELNAFLAKANSLSQALAKNGVTLTVPAPVK